MYTCSRSRRICWMLSRERVGGESGGLVCHYYQSVEEAWWAASGESWWTGSGRNAVCPLVSEDWVRGGWKNRGHMDPLVVQHPSGVPDPGPESLQVYSGYVHRESRKIISKHLCCIPLSLHTELLHHQKPRIWTPFYKINTDSSKQHQVLQIFTFSSEFSS